MTKRGDLMNEMCEHCTAAALWMSCGFTGSTVLDLTGRLCKLSSGVGRGAAALVTFSALSVTLLLSSSRVSALHPITAKQQPAERVPPPHGNNKLQIRPL